MSKLLLLLSTLALFIVNVSQADPLLETRYCGSPKRNANGEIVRRADVLAAFRKVHPCPATGLTKGACPGWQIDHVLPLANGFCDYVINMQWLPIVLKTGTGKYPKDRWERKINASPMQIVPMPTTGVLTIN